jgi:silicon transporter
MPEPQMEKINLCDKIKYFYSTCLLLFSVVIIMGLIFNRQTKISSEVHPALAFVVIWAVVIWLSVVEGGQASFVGLAPVNKELYKDSHKIAYKCSVIVHTGDSLDRYLMGRQFMVLFIVFITNLCGAPVADAQLWGLPKWLTNMFLVTGLAMIFFTAMVGQLNSQVNASRCMLDYVNTYMNLFTLYVAMAIEFSGIMHASYLVAIFVAWCAGKPIESKEAPRSAAQAIFFYGRCIMSVVILLFSFAVTLAALFDGKTTMWDGVPEAVSVILFFVLMSVVGLLEGMQIAFFAVAKIPKSERGDSYFAKKTCDLLFKGHGRNLPGFMIGRQLCVVSCFFIIARVTTISIAEGEENIFGVSDGLQNFFNTGLLGAVITTIVGSISWQLVASAFPIAFLSNPFTYIFLNICLFLEATGVCSGAWVLAWIHRNIAGFQFDEAHIGTAEERAAKGNEDHKDDLPLGAGHILKLPGFAEEEDFPEALKQLMKNDASVRQYIASLHEKEEGQGAVDPDI